MAKLKLVGGMEVPYPVDMELVDAIRANEPYTVIFADMGLATRMSMVYWALLAGGTSLMVTPKSFHGGLIQELGRPEWRADDDDRRMRIVTPESLLSHRPTPTRRVLLEMNNMGVTQKNFVRECKDARVSLCIRCLHQKPEELFEWLKPFGFKGLEYALRPTIRLLP